MSREIKLKLRNLLAGSLLISSFTHATHPPGPLLETALTVFGEEARKQRKLAKLLLFSQFQSFWCNFKVSYKNIFNEAPPQVLIRKPLQPIALLGALVIMDYAMAEKQSLPAAFSNPSDFFWTSVLYATKLFGTGRTNTKEFAKQTSLNPELLIALEWKLASLVLQFPLSNVEMLEYYAQIFNYPME